MEPPARKRAASLRGAAPDLEAAGQDTLGFDAVLGALLHNLPDVQNAAANFFLGPPPVTLDQCALVGQHQLRDGDVAGCGFLQEFLRAVKGIRNRSSFVVAGA